MRFEKPNLTKRQKVEQMLNHPGTSEAEKENCRRILKAMNEKTTDVVKPFSNEGYPVFEAEVRVAPVDPNVVWQAHMNNMYSNLMSELLRDREAQARQAQQPAQGSSGFGFRQERTERALQCEVCLKVFQSIAAPEEPYICFDCSQKHYSQGVNIFHKCDICGVESSSMVIESGGDTKCFECANKAEEPPKRVNLFDFIFGKRK